MGGSGELYPSLFWIIYLFNFAKPLKEKGMELDLQRDESVTGVASKEVYSRLPQVRAQFHVVVLVRIPLGIHSAGQPRNHHGTLHSAI